ncbi:MAG TPA: FdrA family protein, partial [Candidatus Eisenbacteria bacterium]|nr:FdrA family protein [Candidatus Eisenbacteria bacterium]
LATPVQLALLGPGRPDLAAAARQAVEAVGRPWHEPRSWPPEPATDEAVPGLHRGTALRGLFAGGTLCDEAMLIASAALGPVRSNIPLDPGWALPADLTADGHLMIDFGDDLLTRGRAHPMIDQRTRLDRLAQEAADPSAGVILLDVVLGHGAHPDPAAELGPAIGSAVTAARRTGRDLRVVVSLCGSEADPQGLDRQVDMLRRAGASVHLSNAAAARAAVDLVEVSA